MKSQQLSLLQFFKPLEESKPRYTTQMGTSAKLTLEPHFFRPIPEDQRYVERLQEEYDLIDRNNFSRVFLQVKKILELVKTLGDETQKPVPHIIRGSAGSSLVCFLLGITQIDPIKYGIELARFMNRCRTDIPDIDIDVPYNRREEIYKKIAQTWPNQVGRVSNHVMWKAKSALRESTKEILNEKQQTADVQKALKQVRSKNFTLNKVLPNATDAKQAQTSAKEKVGTLRTHSKHCGGIVLFEEEGSVPANWILKPLNSGAQTIFQLTLNKDEVEDEGCIKIDLLSNRGLAQLAEICPTRPLTAYPTRDAQTERIFAKGHTFGVTFGESRGMRRLFVEMEPHNVEEIAIALALIRPAAAAEGRKQIFIEKWRTLNREASKDATGLLRPIVFDDDAILKVRKALGCDAAEADRWRKAFAKQSAQARVDFRKLLIEKGHPRVIQDAIIDDMEQLMHYSFCKSHALSYAQLVWCLAYWKAHHPHAFWCASLNHCNSEFRTWVHYREARTSGLLLSREPPPYKLGSRNGTPALLPVATSEQQLLTNQETEQQAICDMRAHGYWLTEAFLPSCGLWDDSQTRLDGKKMVRFCGVIASSRVVSRNGNTCTMLCIGVENGSYIDIVIPNESRSDLFRYGAVEGHGILKETSSKILVSVEVKKIKGRSIQSLLVKN
jgi:DNA polymerase III alpha subunit